MKAKEVPAQEIIDRCELSDIEFSKSLMEYITNEYNKTNSQFLELK